MSRDFETLYYEQQANFTESNGMLHSEVEHWKKKAADCDAYAEESRDAMRLAHNALTISTSASVRVALAAIDAALAKNPTTVAASGAGLMTSRGEEPSFHQATVGGSYPSGYYQSLRTALFHIARHTDESSPAVEYIQEIGRLLDVPATPSQGKEA